MKDSKTMSLADIKAQIESLQRQADEMVKAEKSGIVSDMRTKIVEYGITAGELGFGGTSKTTRSTTPKTAAVVKYKNNEGKTWSGGRGPKPGWVKEILDAGGDIEKYRI